MKDGMFVKLHYDIIAGDGWDFVEVKFFFNFIFFKGRT